jgi:chromosome segregation ATPase
MEPSTSPDSSKGKKETARDLRKRNKRLADSRDSLQEKNRVQSQKLKAARGKIDDLVASRNAWKRECEHKDNEQKALKEEINTTKNKNNELENFIKEQEKQRDLQNKAKEEEKARYEQQIADLKKKYLELKK